MAVHAFQLANNFCLPLRDRKDIAGSFSDYRPTVFPSIFRYVTVTIVAREPSPVHGFGDYEQDVRVIKATRIGRGEIERGNYGSSGSSSIRELIIRGRLLILMKPRVSKAKLRRA